MSAFLSIDRIRCYAPLQRVGSRAGGRASVPPPAPSHISCHRRAATANSACAGEVEGKGTGRMRGVGAAAGAAGRGRGGQGPRPHGGLLARLCGAAGELVPIRAGVRERMRGGGAWPCGRVVEGIFPIFFRRFAALLRYSRGDFSFA